MFFKHKLNPYIFTLLFSFTLAQDSSEDVSSKLNCKEDIEVELWGGCYDIDTTDSLVFKRENQSRI